MKVVPEYPKEVIGKNIGGVVSVKFIVDRGGSTYDARIIESKPERIFDNASLEAVSRFKFLPKVVNGKRVLVENVIYEIIFQPVDKLGEKKG